MLFRNALCSCTMGPAGVGTMIPNQVLRGMAVDILGQLLYKALGRLHWGFSLWKVLEQWGRIYT